MFGSVFLLAAAISSDTGPASPRHAPGPSFRPTSGVTTQATATIRIVSGVRFGRDESPTAAPEASRRAISLTEKGGRLIPIELLEFQ
jgi:hypothetical protein